MGIPPSEHSINIILESTWGVGAPGGLGWPRRILGALATFPLLEFYQPPLSGLWSVVFGQRSLVSGLWSLVFGSLVFGLFSLVSGLWSLVLGLWSLVFGLWSLVSGLWSLSLSLWGCWSLVSRSTARTLQHECMELRTHEGLKQLVSSYDRVMADQASLQELWLGGKPVDFPRGSSSKLGLCARPGDRITKARSACSLGLPRSWSRLGVAN